MNVSALLAASDFSNNDDSASIYSLLAMSSSWRAVFVASYAVEFICSCSVKLLALDRMSVLLEHSMRLSWAIGRRVVMWVTAAGCAVVLGGNVAVAFCFTKCSRQPLSLSRPPSPRFCDTAPRHKSCASFAANYTIEVPFTSTQVNSKRSLPFISLLCSRLLRPPCCSSQSLHALQQASLLQLPLTRNS